MRATELLLLSSSPLAPSAASAPCADDGRIPVDRKIEPRFEALQHGIDLAHLDDPNRRVHWNSDGRGVADMARLVLDRWARRDAARVAVARTPQSGSGDFPRPVHADPRLARRQYGACPERYAGEVLDEPVDRDEFARVSQRANCSRILRLGSSLSKAGAPTWRRGDGLFDEFCFDGAAIAVRRHCRRRRARRRERGCSPRSCRRLGPLPPLSRRRGRRTALTAPPRAAGDDNLECMTCRSWARRCCVPSIPMISNREFSPNGRTRWSAWSASPAEKDPSPAHVATRRRQNVHVPP